MKKSFLLVIGLLALVLPLLGCGSSFGRVEVGVPARRVVEILGEPAQMDSTNTHWLYLSQGESLRVTFSTAYPRERNGVVAEIARSPR